MAINSQVGLEPRELVTTGVQTCTRCVLDLAVPNIQFDEQGVCNYCTIHDDSEKQFPLDDSGKQKLSQLIGEVKERGRNREYDCIVGVSGGVDSTFTLYNTVKLGLRPLAVQFDNGWHSEIAVTNIKNAVTKLNVDLHTVVVDWEEFKDILRSFLMASVPDTDIATDIGIKSTLYRAAVEEGIKYIITGGNFRTEGQIPRGWTYMDGRYIRSVHKKFGEAKIRKFPNLTMTGYLNYVFVKRIKLIRIVNYLDYRKEEAKELIRKELGWRDYGGKHYESVFTRFNNGYLCPRKFNIDKRKVEFSALVRSGQLTREEALCRLSEAPIPQEKEKEELEYVRKKLDFSREEFQEILFRPPKSYLDYPTYYPMIKRIKPLIDFVSRYISRL